MFGIKIERNHPKLKKIYIYTSMLAYTKPTKLTKQKVKLLLQQTV